ncbi:TetR/AcrR family transcriptional regulator [Bifidobacterium simiarum]|uniref:TetR family transcriptional regulator n=1 Tax=Bifidobacterium simiarum TaxID=2045441 RepID=A0A2M9HCC1_9BIFI|nr:TetR/AcrR family transcriptional regulator [Bifidobacterium simiarum]PJM74460.1 TetR family transcriptional regulator [Bifidobacterium simiarum]
MTKKAQAALDRRRSMLDTTARFIAQHGFWGLRLREIAIEQHMTEAGLLYHFKSKEGLLIALLDYRDREDRRALYSRLGIELPESGEIAETMPVGLRELTIATAERNADQPEMVRLYTVLQAEALSGAHPAYDYFRDREQWVLREYVSAAEHDGVADPRRVAMDALAAMDGLQLRWLHDVEHIDLVAEWTHLIDVILAQ